MEVTVTWGWFGGSSPPSPHTRALLHAQGEQSTWETGNFSGGGRMGAAGCLQDGSLCCRTVLPLRSATRALLYGPTLPINGQSLFSFYCSSLCPSPGLCPVLPGWMIPTSSQGCSSMPRVGKTPDPAGRRAGGMHAGHRECPARSSTGLCCPESARSCWELSRDLLGLRKGKRFQQLPGEVGHG